MYFCLQGKFIKITRIEKSFTQTLGKFLPMIIIDYRFEEPPFVSNTTVVFPDNLYWDFFQAIVDIPDIPSNLNLFQVLKKNSPEDS